jgi:hypothetical protein
MKLNTAKLWVLCLCSLVVSACNQVNAPSKDFLALVTPKIENYPNGSYISDRLLMIPFDKQQTCTDAVASMLRLNPQTMSIEMCQNNQWQAHFVSVSEVKKDASICTRKSKRK